MATPVKNKPQSKSHASPTQRSWVAEWVVTFLMYLFGTTTLLQAFVVPSGSMENTMLVGDHLLVDKLAYAPTGSVTKYLLPYQDVKRGDVIVFRYPLDTKQNYVKRVIGVPGDHVRFANKTLWLNGHPVNEPYKVLIPSRSSTYLDNFPQTPDFQIYPRGIEMMDSHVGNGELIVPEGQYFALGDNRDNSSDSRFWGLVPRENIIGKPVIVWWSYDAPTERLADGNLNIDHIGDIALHFFTKTRWDRMFLLVHGYPLN